MTKPRLKHAAAGAGKTANPAAPATGTGYNKIKIRRVYEEVCDQIRLQLKTGQLKTGDKLPSERELAERLGVSRVVVREALRTLEMSGIVQLRLGVKGGAFVREGSAEVLTRSFENLMMLGRISMTNVADARRMIHGAVLQNACEHGTSKDFDAVEANLRLLDQLAMEEDWLGRAEAAVHFFHLLAKATHNEVMVMIVDAMSELLRYVAREKAVNLFSPELVPIRWKILAKLRARDTKRAIALMDEYLEIVHARVTLTTKATSRTLGNSG